MPTLILVGGFLGAGKTTLILKAAELLRAQGRRVAYISNDQDAGLVDTLHAEALTLPTAEVTKGCFCCRFSDLLNAAALLAAFDPDIIFAEPVGSCTDLSATILQPLLSFERATFRVMPFTVVVDPAQADKLVRNELPSEIAFLTRNQIAEADILCLTKQDLSVTPSAILPFPVDFRLSGQNGSGVEAWLNEVLSGNRITGSRLLDIDYTVYAEAEAALGWLNLHADLTLHNAASPASVAGPLLDDLNDQLSACGITIAHLKIFDRATSGWIKASISTNNSPVEPSGTLLADPALHHQVAINLRALADPKQLEQIATRALQNLPGQLSIGHIGAFRPSAPIPEHRFTSR